MSEMKSHGERREDDKDLQLTSNFFFSSLTHSLTLILFYKEWEREKKSRVTYNTTRKTERRKLISRNYVN